MAEPVGCPIWAETWAEIWATWGPKPAVIWQLVEKKEPKEVVMTQLFLQPRPVARTGPDDLTAAGLAARQDAIFEAWLHQKFPLVGARIDASDIRSVA